MKKIIMTFIALTVVLVGNSQEMFNKTFDGTIVRHVVAANFSGPVNVKKSSSDKISVKVKRTGDELHPEVSLELIERDDYIIIYLRTPCSKPEAEIVFNKEEPMNYQNWKSECHWQAEADMAFSVLEFEIFLPDGVNIYAQTLFNGDITVTGISDDVYVHNINGSVHLSGIERLREATTVNGNIDVEFKNIPLIPANLSTINGEISIETIENGDFSATFKSFQGDLYTDHEKIQVMPLKTKNEKNDVGFKLTMSEVKSLKIGKGGPVIAVETFNGDAYLTKK